MLNESLNKSIQNVKKQLYDVIYPTINEIVDESMSDEEYQMYEDTMDILNEIDKDFVELEFYLNKISALQIVDK